jgi:dTDP-4-dehydrorhamnose 3,5-epimerase
MNFEFVADTDARLIRPIVHRDERGCFARTWCAETFSQAGVAFVPQQGNSSLSTLRGTVRGMHFQRPPHSDAKIVRCSRGRIHDVIVDLRPESPTRGRIYAQELTAVSGVMLYIPGGFAHGFQTLVDDTLVEYLMGEFHVADLYDGFRYDDPALPIVWPEPVRAISDRDRGWPDIAPRTPWLADSAPAGAL